MNIDKQNLKFVWKVKVHKQLKHTQQREIKWEYLPNITIYYRAEANETVDTVQYGWYGVDRMGCDGMRLAGMKKVGMGKDGVG